MIFVASLLFRSYFSEELPTLKLDPAIEGVLAHAGSMTLAKHAIGWFVPRLLPSSNWTAQVNLLLSTVVVLLYFIIDSSRALAVRIIHIVYPIPSIFLLLMVMFYFFGRITSIAHPSTIHLCILCSLLAAPLRKGETWCLSRWQKRGALLCR